MNKMLLIITLVMLVSCSRLASVKFENKIKKYSKEKYLKTYKDTTLVLGNKILTYREGTLCSFSDKYWGKRFYMKCINSAPVMFYKKLNDSTNFPIVHYNTDW